MTDFYVKQLMTDCHENLPYGRKMSLNHLADIYAYRQLIEQLEWNEFKVKYEDSVLGYYRTLLEPLAKLIILNNLSSCLTLMTKSICLKIDSM